MPVLAQGLESAVREVSVDAVAGANGTYACLDTEPMENTAHRRPLNGPNVVGKLHPAYLRSHRGLKLP